MKAIIVKSGRVIDPASGIDAVLDLSIVDGHVADIAPSISESAYDRVIDAAGLLVTPAWIDAHVHLRDPGQEYKEDLISGAEAAVAGGFARLCCMPNTNPPLDTVERIQDIIKRGARTKAHIHPIGTITVGRKLQNIAPIREMARAGAIGFSDDGESTDSIEAMREALSISAEINRPIMVHCEDPALIGGSMHRGEVSERIGDPGIPADAEERYIERDIALAEETGGWLHVLHVSTDRGANMIRDAKQRGVRVTAEVMPHHLILTDEWVAGVQRIAGEAEVRNLGHIDSNAKVNPPLRPESDALALIEHLQTGTFDFIATDHAPHAERDKPAKLRDAAFGMSGLELAIPSLSILIRRGEFDWPFVVDYFTRRPAETLGLPGGTLQTGVAADVVLIDPERAWTVEPATLRSRSKNTPLLGRTVTGRAVMTIVGGEVMHDELS